MCCLRWCRRQLGHRNKPISGVDPTPRPTAVYAPDPTLPWAPVRLAPVLLARLWTGQTCTGKLIPASPNAPCIRLSDKTSRLRPRHVAPKPGQTHEPAGLVEVREWIAAALAASGLVLEPQPPAQPHSRIAVDRAIRRSDGAYREVVRPSAKRAVQHSHQLCGFLPRTCPDGQLVDLFDDALDALL